MVTDLASLHGPTGGVAVELPLRLFWSSPDRTFDLSEPFQRRWLYQTVLREASRPEDLTSYLNGRPPWSRCGRNCGCLPGCGRRGKSIIPALRAAAARPA